jgi:hypothetical protein
MIANKLLGYIILSLSILVYVDAENLNYFRITDTPNTMYLPKADITVENHGGSIGKSRVTFTFLIGDKDLHDKIKAELQPFEGHVNCNLDLLRLECVIYGNEIKHLVDRQVSEDKAYYKIGVKHLHYEHLISYEFEVNQNIQQIDQDLMAIIGRVSIHNNLH